MAFYEYMFQAAVILFLAYFVFWLISIFIPGKGLDSIAVAFTYPTIITVLLGAIMALLREEISLPSKFMLMGIAIVWTITGLMLEYEPQTRGQKVFRFIIQFVSLVGAYILIQRYFLFFSLPF